MKMKIPTNSSKIHTTNISFTKLTRGKFFSYFIFHTKSVKLSPSDQKIAKRWRNLCWLSGGLIPLFCRIFLYNPKVLNDLKHPVAKTNQKAQTTLDMKVKPSESAKAPSAFKLPQEPIQKLADKKILPVPEPVKGKSLSGNNEKPIDKEISSPGAPLPAATKSKEVPSNAKEGSTSKAQGAETAKPKEDQVDSKLEVSVSETVKPKEDTSPKSPVPDPVKPKGPPSPQLTKEQRSQVLASKTIAEIMKSSPEQLDKLKNLIETNELTIIPKLAPNDPKSLTLAELRTLPRDVLESLKDRIPTQLHCLLSEDQKRSSLKTVADVLLIEDEKLGIYTLGELIRLNALLPNFLNRMKESSIEIQVQNMPEELSENNFHSLTLAQFLGTPGDKINAFINQLPPMLLTIFTEHQIKGLDFSKLSVVHQKIVPQLQKQIPFINNDQYQQISKFAKIDMERIKNFLTAEQLTSIDW